MTPQSNEMALSLSASNLSQDLTGKDSDDEKDALNKVNTERTSNIPERPISLEDIKIHLIDDGLTLESQKRPDEHGISNSNSASEGSRKEIKPEHPSNSEDNSLDEEEEQLQVPEEVPEQQGNGTVVRRRRIGVVEASDKVIGERTKARVLQKRFGEGVLVAEMPCIFNKKL